MTKKKCQSVSEHYLPSKIETSWLAEEPCLAPTRAFVVQCRGETETPSPYFRGQVEHIVSGRAMRFPSPTELLAFFAPVLNTIGAKPP
jgi:hypothetical protein